MGVENVEIDGKIGTNGLDTSGCNHATTNKSIGRTLMDGSGISRTPRMKSLRPAYARRHAKTIGLLLVLAAAAIMIVSAVALVPSSKEKISPPTLPEKSFARLPPPPYTIFGFLYLSDGVTIVVGADVTVTDTRSGLVVNTVSDEFGYYNANINDEFNPYAAGDPVEVIAVFGTLSGTASGIADDGMGPLGPNLPIDVIMVDTGIPEFSMVFVPVVGMMALVVAVSLMRRGEEP